MVVPGLELLRWPGSQGKAASTLKAGKICLLPGLRLQSRIYIVAEVGPGCKLVGIVDTDSDYGSHWEEIASLG